MTDTHCPSCGHRIAPAVLAAGGAARCPRCGDPLTLPPDDATVTVAPRPESDLPSTVLPGELTAAHEPGSPLPPASLPSVPGYELLEVIGRGGMGIVYRARQLFPRRVVALKIVLGGNPRHTRFQAEVSAVARLQHPNVVRIHEVGEVGGRQYFSMEYVPGGSLATHLRGGPLPTREAAELVARLARAVQHAHEMGIVHRDLKPANILLTGDRGQGTGARENQDPDSSSLAPGPWPLAPVPKIADFGLAKHLEGSGSGSGPVTQTGAILGTPNYMAPEQAKGKSKQIGPGVDVWALGAILYECLTGRPPFREDSHLDTMMKVISEDPAPPRQLRPAVPRDLETICLKCLRKDPKERYASAAELADDLERFLDGRPIKARSRTVRERVAGWARRRREYLFLAAGAALIAGLALAVFDWSGPRRPPEPGSSLPPDLRLVPPDAFVFATVRVADVWKNPATRELVNHLARGDRDTTLDAFGKHIDSVTSIHPDNIERATFVLPDENSRGGPLIILATAEPFLHHRLRDMLADRGNYTHREVAGKRMYVPDNPRGGDRAFLVVSDHVLVLGDPELLRKVATEPEHGAGPLTPMLERAAGGHTLVVGSFPPGKVVSDWLVNDLQLRPEADSVARLQTIGVALDLGHPAGPGGRVTIDAAAWVGYPSAEQAEAARPNMPGVVRALSERVLEKQLLLPLPPEAVTSLVAPVKAAAWERDGDTLHAAARIAAELATVKAQLDEVVWRRESAANMRRIAWALRQYHDEYKRFPPAVVTDADGKPLYSWRVELLPYLGEEALYRRFHLNRAWDHPSNRPLLDQMPAVFAAPGARGANTTPYQVLTGAGGLFDSADGRSIAEITDGPQRTILIVEAPNAVAWTQPADVVFGADSVPRLGGVVPSGFHAAMADGTVHLIPHSAATPALLRGLFTRAGGEMVSPP